MKGMLLEALFLGIIVGKLRGGKFIRLGHLAIKVPYLAYTAFILWLVTSIMITRGHDFFIQYRMYLYICSFGFLFLGLFFNLHHRPAWLILIGSILNFAAITLNSGSMPVDLSVLQNSGLNNMLTSINSGVLPNYISIEEARSFTVYLGKYIGLPAWYPLRDVLSIGDIFVSIGLFLLIESMMVSSISRRTIKTIKFDYKKGM